MSEIAKRLSQRKKDLQRDIIECILRRDQLYNEKSKASSKAAEANKKLSQLRIGKPSPAVEEKVKADIKYWKRRREDAKDKSEKIDRELEKLHKVEHGFQNALTMLQGVDQ